MIQSFILLCSGVYTHFKIKPARCFISHTHTHTQVAVFSFSPDKAAVSANICVHVISVTQEKCQSECAYVGIKSNFQR